MHELTLAEYQTKTGIPLTPEERDTLRSIAPSIAVTPTVGTGDLYDLTPGSTIGTIQTDTLSIEIRPKLPIDRVLFLVSFGLGIAKFRPEDFRFGAEPDLFEAIIPGFTAQIRRAFRRGLLQGYRSEETALPTVRGRIRFEDQLRDRYGIFPPAEVRFDEYTEDIELNRLIKAAITRLGRIRIRSETARAELRAFDTILSRVAQIEYQPRGLPTTHFDRLNQHYEPAVRLAELILRSASLELLRGEVQAATFLMDMNDVFENFVVAALRDALHLTDRSFPQGARGRSLKLDQAGRIGLEPDISWWDGTRCAFVGDVKYKRTRDQRAPNADLYQLLAYTTATNLPGGLLIYAAGEEDPIRHRVRFADKTLEIVSLDLGGQPAEVLEQINGVADRIRAYRAGAIALRAA